MLATVNRWIGTGLLALGVGIAAVGVYLGGFAWLNDGVKAGVKLFATAAAFASALAATGVALRFAAEAHARSDPRRWWIQLGTLVVAYAAFGLAAWTTSVLDRLGRR